MTDNAEWSRAKVAELSAGDIPFIDCDLFDEVVASSLRGGISYAWRTPLTRGLMRGLWLPHGEARMAPAALFCGIRHGLTKVREHGVLRYARGSVVVEQVDKTLVVHRDGDILGFIECSPLLRILNFGRALLRRRTGEVLCELRLPVFGPTSPQRRDVFGSFEFPSGERLRFALAAKGTAECAWWPYGESGASSGAANPSLRTVYSLFRTTRGGARSDLLFSRHPATESTPLLADIERGSCALVDSDRAVLVIAATWARMFSIGTP